MTRLLLSALLLLACLPAFAQEHPVPESAQFADFLSSCLGTRDARVNQCVVEYVEADHRGILGNFTSGPYEPAARSVVKGKYNTCYLYPDSELAGDEKGYECFSNLTGKCVSGDCCNFGGC